MDQSLRQKVQAEVVNIITRGLEEGTISEERAREMAKLILEKLPEGVSDEELLAIIPKLDDEFTELTEVVLPIVTEYEQKIRTAVEEKALKLVRDQKFTEALELARKGIEMAKNLN